MVQPMRDGEGNYTYADIIISPEGERWELIDGVAYDMSPTPLVRHQEILGALLMQFHPFVEHTPCRLYLGPLDVRLPTPSENGMTASTVLQPDILIVCEREKLDELGCIGAPTLVVEITSPWTTAKDLREKRAVYERVGVPEYWIILPSDLLLLVFTLDETGRYGAPTIYLPDEQVPVRMLPGAHIDLARVFAAR